MDSSHLASVMAVCLDYMDRPKRTFEDSYLAKSPKVLFGSSEIMNS